MTLLTCRECGNGVSSLAAACPKCGAPVPKLKRKLSQNEMLGGLVVGLGIICYVAYISSHEPPPPADISGDPTPTAAPPQPQSPPPPPPPSPFAQYEESNPEIVSASIYFGGNHTFVTALPTNAAEIYRTYHENEVAADNYYKGHYLLVDATASSIEKDISDAPYLKFALDEYGINDVQASLNEIQLAPDGDGNLHPATVSDIASRLHRGQRVSVLCITGGMIMETPMLKQCVLDPAILWPQLHANPAPTAR